MMTVLHMYWQREKGGGAFNYVDMYRVHYVRSAPYVGVDQFRYRMWMDTLHGTI